MYENGRHIYFIFYSLATQIRQKFSFTFKFYVLDTTLRFNNSSRTFSGAFLILFMTMRKRKRGAKKSPPPPRKRKIDSRIHEDISSSFHESQTTCFRQKMSGFCNLGDICHIFIYS